MLKTARLFDITTRHALYVEQVKGGMFLELQKVLGELSNELKKLFASLTYRTLDVLNKTKLQQFVVILRRLTSRVFGSMANKLIAQIEKFMYADLRIQKQMFVNEVWSGSGIPTEEESDEFIAGWISLNRNKPIFGTAAILGGGAGLWAYIRNNPMPANGATLPAFMSSYTASAQKRLEDLVRQGWANGISVEELTAIITGTPGAALGGISAGSSSQVERIFNQGKAVLDTQMQHVSQVVSAGVSSAIFNKYVWNAILDRGTCETCRARDGRIFDYSNGPKPPAHTRCRCSIVPAGDDLAAAAAISAVSLGEWLASQPKDVQNEWAGNYAKGEYGVMTVSQFERKLRRILT